MQQILKEVFGDYDRFWKNAMEEKRTQRP
jgi:hypothetical protein